MKTRSTKKTNKFLSGARMLGVGVLALFGLQSKAQTTFNFTGSLQTYTVPVGVTSIHIDGTGAQGGSVSVSCAATGGLGARMQGDFTVTPGEVLSIMVGEQGHTNGSDAGGGGGTFVVRTGNVALLVAGGGGGATNNITSCGANRNGIDATITTSGTASGNGLVAGGTNGNGGGASTGSGGGGGGFLTDGVAGTGLGGNNGKCYLNGGAGGTGNNNDFGGYGGGGAGWYTGGNGGGGGGYSGGGTSGSIPYTGGGGGGSYNAGTNQINTAGFQTGNGRVIITINYSASIAQTSQILCNGGTNGALTVTPNGGTSPYTYSWSPSGGTGATASGLGAGTYTVTVTDANLATTTQTFTITQPSAITTVNTQMNPSCNGGNNGNAGVAVSGGTPGYTYAWSTGGTGSMEMNLIAGSYTCVITDANGCANTQTFSLTQPTAMTAATTQNNPMCNGGTGNATVTVSGGTPGYTYSWSSGGTAATETGLASGSYSCTITDANGCTTTQTVTIVAPTAITATLSSTDISCNGGNNGSATVTATGGTPGYTYLWSPSGGTAATASGLFMGSYTCTITDANGCTTTQTVTLTEPTALSTSSSATSILCNGGTADITVGASGGTLPYSGDGIFTMPAGAYVYTVTDANGCTSTTSITVTEPAALVASLTTSTDPTTCGGMDGAIDITVTGGTPGYTYLWSNSATTEDISGVGAGTYSNDVTDANGCITTVSVTLVDPNPPTVTLTLGVSSVCAADAQVTLSGGSPAGGVYSGTAVTAGVFNPATATLGANTITYTYTDPVTGCSASNTGVITVNACTGIANVGNENNFTLFPNPNNGTFMLYLNTTDVAQVMIYDALGQLVSQQTVQPNAKQELSIANSGVYMIAVVTADGHRTTQRVVVNK